MHTITSFQGSAVGPDELTRIMTDYLALEHARIFRRLLVTRSGFLALATALGGGVLHWLPRMASWSSVGVFLLLPVWAWIVELGRARRLARRLEDVPGAITDASHR